MAGALVVDVATVVELPGVDEVLVLVGRVVVVAFVGAPHAADRLVSPGEAPRA
ncbi:MAG: hypothetical protein ACRD12_19435 [Acidimicrobiales bacterium]